MLNFYQQYYFYINIFINFQSKYEKYDNKFIF